MFECKACLESKDDSEYRVHKRGYRIGKCRPCERAYQVEWSRKDPETYRRRKRESMSRRRAEDIDAARAYARADHAANHGARTTKMREYIRRRFFWNKAMKLRGNDRATYKQLAALWKTQRGRCALTGRRLDRSAQLDHIEARARGGHDRIDNLQWLCAPANYAKRDLSQSDFLKLCADVNSYSQAPCMTCIGKRIDEQMRTTA